MPCVVTCRCGGTFKAADFLVGKRVKCPSCGQPLTVPAQATPQPAASPVTSSSGKPIVVSCLCGQSFKARVSLAGTRAAFPACARPLDIPSATKARLPGPTPT